MNYKLNDMKKILIITAIFLLGTLTSKGQNLFFIGEKHYPCTEEFSLPPSIPRNMVITGRPIYSSSTRNDVDILIAKDGQRGLFVISDYTNDYRNLIKGKLLIYLDDLTVITCIDRGKYDYVNNIATTIYYLTPTELNKMKNSNINKIRYSLNIQGDFTASNIVIFDGYRENKYKNERGWGETKYIFKDTVRNDFPTAIKNLFEN